MDCSLGDSSLILYQTEDGQTRVEVHLLDETVWLTQTLIATPSFPLEFFFSPSLHRAFYPLLYKVCG